jgi:hypothetical protein
MVVIGRDTATDVVNDFVRVEFRLVLFPPIAGGISGRFEVAPNAWDWYNRTAFD